MANSSIISDVKENLCIDMITDDAITTAIDALECQSPTDYLNTHIFRYNKNPNTITKDITFITIMVHTSARDRAGTYISPTIEIWIYSHNDHIELRDGEIPGITDDRNTYISKLLDKKINGVRGYGGIGEWRLTLNAEGTFNEKFLYRKMLFENIEVNNSFCGR